MTQIAPPAAADDDQPPRITWDLQRPLPEADHPTDPAPPPITRPYAANPARVRPPDIVDALFHPERLGADDPSSLRTEGVAGVNDPGHTERVTAAPPDPAIDVTTAALLRIAARQQEELAAQQPTEPPSGGDINAAQHPWEAAKQLIEAARRDNELPPWAADLIGWWGETARGDIGGSIKKVVEYGGRGAAYDLLATGHDLAAMNGRTATDQEATELAILFYLSSKVNRWFAAAIDGRRPSDDTLLDIVYYGMMARRNRAVGGWPVAPHNEERAA